MLRFTSTIIVSCAALSVTEEDVNPAGVVPEQPAFSALNMYCVLDVIRHNFYRIVV